jgi:hypothetical protein
LLLGAVMARPFLLPRQLAAGTLLVCHRMSGGPPIGRDDAGCGAAKDDGGPARHVHPQSLGLARLQAEMPADPPIDAGGDLLARWKPAPPHPPGAYQRREDKSNARNRLCGERPGAPGRSAPHLQVSG